MYASAFLVLIDEARALDSEDRLHLIKIGLLPNAQTEADIDRAVDEYKESAGILNSGTLDYEKGVDMLLRAQEMNQGG